MKILRLNIFPQGMSFPKLNQEQDLGEGNQEVQIIRHKQPPKTMRRGSRGGVELVAIGAELISGNQTQSEGHKYK